MQVPQYRIFIEKMPGPFSIKRSKESVTLSTKTKHAKTFDSPLLPGLPDDVAKHCLSLVPRSNFPAMAAVCKRWRSFMMKSNELVTIRRLGGLLEEWLYVLTADPEGSQSRWEVLDCLGGKRQLLPMPGPVRVGFGVVVLYGKLLVIAGCSVVDGAGSVSSDVYQYDSCLNSWTKLANMNVPRYDFACTEVNGLIYAVGGCGQSGDSLSSAEMYDPNTDKWTLIDSMRRPRWNCFAAAFAGKLYVMGGRSSFSIGNSKFVDIYDPDKATWRQLKNGCVMVTAYAVLGDKLCCMEWKNERKLTIFDPADNSWRNVAVPVTGSSSVGFRFGVFERKLLLFSGQEDPGYRTLVYDPDAEEGKEWGSCGIKPSGLCLCSVTIKA